MLNNKLLDNEHWHLHKAVQTLRQGGIIAYPTEAVFGLGCDPHNETALRRLLHLKQRPWQKGMILIAADFSRLAPWLLPLPAEIMNRVQQSWPGPVTWLLPMRPTVSPLLRGNHAQLAVRVTDHPLAAALCHRWGGPLVSTSANISNHPPARSAQRVRHLFGTRVDCILHGNTGERTQPSEIRDAFNDKRLR